MTQVIIEKTKPNIHETARALGVWTEFNDNQGQYSPQTNNTLRKSAGIIVRIIGLFMGSRFITPILEVVKENPFTTAQLPL
jgi:hypothetical protein